MWSVRVGNCKSQTKVSYPLAKTTPCSGCKEPGFILVIMIIPWTRFWRYPKCFKLKPLFIHTAITHWWWWATGTAALGQTDHHPTSTHILLRQCERNVSPIDTTTDLDATGIERTTLWLLNNLLQFYFASTCLNFLIFHCCSANFLHFPQSSTKKL